MQIILLERFPSSPSGLFFFFFFFFLFFFFLVKHFAVGAQGHWENYTLLTARLQIKNTLYCVYLFIFFCSAALDMQSFWICVEGVTVLSRHSYRKHKHVNLQRINQA